MMRVSVITPIFATLYGGIVGAAMGPAIEAMLTMRPAFRSMKCGVIALHVRKTDFVLTAKVRSQSSSVLFVNGIPGGPAAPALLTRMSILPNDSRVRSTIVLTSAALVTSVFMARTLRPSPLTSPATFSAFSTWMSGMAMSAPSRAIASTMPRPIPLPPPVTTATLPASRMETPSIYSRCPGGTHDSTPAQKPQLVRVQRPLAKTAIAVLRVAGKRVGRRPLRGPRLEQVGGRPGKQASVERSSVGPARYRLATGAPRASRARSPRAYRSEGWSRRRGHPPPRSGGALVPRHWPTAPLAGGAEVPASRTPASPHTAGYLRAA